MAIRLRTKSGSNCCACAEQNGCDCNGLPCFLECRDGAGPDGFATLCGWAEYVETLPPKKYKKQRYDEDFVFCNWTNTTCSGGPGTFGVTRNRVVDATSIYNPAACTATTVGVRELRSASVPNGCPSDTDVDNGTDGGHSAALVVNASSTPHPGFQLQSATPTVLLFQPTTMCYGAGFGQSGIVTSGFKEWALSQEDTEDAAILRRAPEVDLSPVLGGCLTTAAHISVRGAGEFTFSFRRVQARVRLVGAAVGASYDVTIRFFRRALGSSAAWTFYGQQEMTVVADGSLVTDEYTAWIEVPNATGYETRAQNCSATPTP